MNSKASKKLKERLETINGGTFDEDDIKLLLIEIRDYLQGESILREVCDFIAHPKRNKGICHRRIDSRYAKQFFAKKRTQELINEKVFENNHDKPWSFFSDQILDYIKTDKIEKNLFETIIKEGIEEIDDELFQKYYGLRKNEVKSMISKFYVRDKSGYSLKKGISKKSYFLIDELLKFIRGTFTGKSAFDQSEIEIDILNAIERLTKELSLTVDLNEFKKHLSDIIVCILCIIHDTNFELFDKKIGQSYLSVHPTEDHKTFTLGLVVNTDGFVFQIISTSIDSKTYLDNIDIELDTLTMSQIPWCFSTRDKDGKLRLTKNGA
jgi:uncharacterized membrane-anchored protein YjiN (DUF445 family)